MVSFLHKKRHGVNSCGCQVAMGATWFAPCIRIHLGPISAPYLCALSASYLVREVTEISILSHPAIFHISTVLGNVIARYLFLVRRSRFFEANLACHGS
jgi:hypothetical protein